MKVKICGLKTYADALAAVECGADLLGFNFYPPSPRCIHPRECQRLVYRLRSALGAYPQKVVLVGVFVNAPLAQIRAILSECCLDLAQLSGDEPPQALAELGERAFKGLRPASSASLSRDLQRYPQPIATPAWLVDACRPGAYGGTGQEADWELARTLAEQAPILLAGGLHPENVHLALRQVRPWGVDVASGVEHSPGRKDAQKMAAFIDAVHSYSMEAGGC